MRRLVTEALYKAGREDLIGYGKDCLIRPLHPRGEEEHRSGGKAPAGGRPAGESRGRRKKRASTGGSGSGPGARGAKG